MVVPSVFINAYRIFFELQITLENKPRDSNSFHTEREL